MDLATPPLATFNLPDGSQFLSRARIPQPEPEIADDDIKSFIAETWQRSYEAKRAVEENRLKMCDRFYRGRHYTTAEMNRLKPVTNYCFQTVQAVHTLLTDGSPRPEVVPREFRAAQALDNLQGYAEWKMDDGMFDRFFRLGTLDFAKYGWSVGQLAIDKATSLSYPVYTSTYHVYPDPTARNESEMETLVFAMPVATRRLRALFPNLRDSVTGEHLIQPDNIAGPDYEVNYRDRAEEFGSQAANFSMPLFADSAMSFTREGVTANTTTPLVMANGQRIEYGETTYYFQVFVRDDSYTEAIWDGTRRFRTGQYDGTDIPWIHRAKQPSSPSGWRVYAMTSNGTITQKGKSVDPCFLGLPFVFSRNYWDGNFFYGFGEQDQIIPIQRDINERNDLIVDALRRSAKPPAKTTKNSGLASNVTTLRSGEIIRLNPGGDIEYLEFRGPSQQQFEQLMIRKKDLDDVSGLPPSVEGARPAGIEAGTALRELNMRATSRARAKGPELLSGSAVMLSKLMACDGRKANPFFTVYASNGRPLSMSAVSLTYGLDVRWAEGSATAYSRKEQEEKILGLYDRGLLPAEYVIDRLGLPDAENLKQYAAAMRMAKMKSEAAAAKAKAQNGGGPPQEQ